MIRTAVFLIASSLGGLVAMPALGQLLSTQSTRPTPAVQRRASAIPGRVFPNELAEQFRAIRATTHEPTGGVLRVPADDPDATARPNIYDDRRLTSPPRPFQNANPPRRTAGFVQGGGFAREDQLRAQLLGLQRGAGTRTKAEPFNPVSVGFPFGGGGGLFGGGGGFALIGLR